MTDAAGAGRAGKDGQAAQGLDQPVRSRRPRGPGRDRALRARRDRDLPAGEDGRGRDPGRHRRRHRRDRRQPAAADIGKLMGVLKPALAGQADMGLVSQAGQAEAGRLSRWRAPSSLTAQPGVAAALRRSAAMRADAGR